MVTSLLPAALEVAGLVRQVSAAGGFAMILAKGEPETGAILVVVMEHGANPRAYERMPRADGERVWHLSRREDRLDPGAFADYLHRRQAQDRDLWIVELDVPAGERFIGLTSPVD